MKMPRSSVMCLPTVTIPEVTKIFFLAYLFHNVSSKKFQIFVSLKLDYDFIVFLSISICCDNTLSDLKIACRFKETFSIYNITIIKLFPEIYCFHH